MEFHKPSKKWLIFTSNNKYWSLEKNSGLQAVGAGPSDEKCLFDIEWQGDGMAAIRAPNGKFVNNKPLGALFASADVITEKERFFIRLVNRPLLVLKCTTGYVGIRTGYESTTMECICNKARHDVITLEHGEKGVYYFKGPTMKYWQVTDEGAVNANSPTPTAFVLEFRGQAVMSIRVLATGMYLKAEKSGHIRPVACEPRHATYWQY
jgi:hypothetical protein